MDAIPLADMKKLFEHVIAATIKAKHLLSPDVTT